MNDLIALLNQHLQNYLQSCDRPLLGFLLIAGVVAGLMKLHSLSSFLSIFYLPASLGYTIFRLGKLDFDTILRTWLLVGVLKVLFACFGSLIRCVGKFKTGPEVSMLSAGLGILFGPLGLPGRVEEFVEMFLPQDADEELDAVEVNVTEEPATEDSVLSSLVEDFNTEHDRIWSMKLDYSKVSAQKFKHLDLRFYDKTEKQLSAYGFRRLEDVELPSLRTVGMHKLFIRVLVSSDRAVSVGVYHAKMKFPMSFFMRKLKLKVVDFESECDDGSFVVTSSGEQSNFLNHGDQINQQGHPNLDAIQLGKLHYERLLMHLKQRSTNVLKIQNLENAMAMQQRLQNAKRAARPATGMTLQEFQTAADDSAASTTDLYDRWQAKRNQSSA